MALYALDDIGDAIDATKRFLRPVDRVRWLRLAVVMFFVTSGGLSLQFPGIPGTGSGDFDPGPGFDAGPGTEPPAGPAPGTAPGVVPEMTPELVALVVGLVALVAVLVPGYLLLGAIMEFVFVESLRTEDVRLGAYARENLGRGARLFVFRLVVAALTVTALAGLVLGTGAAVGGWPPFEWSAGAVLAALAVGLPVLALSAVTVGNLLGFTTVFVVPVMVLEDRGVISAWRRFWPTLREQWKQFLVYAVVGFLLGVGVSVASGFVFLVAAVALAIPFLVVGAVVFLVAGLGAVGGGVLLVLVVLYLLLVLVVSLLVQVPFQTFLRYYALFVLGDADDDFDVIPRARDAVRADDGPGSDSVPTE